MDETIKVLIGTISGFSFALFAEPIKIYFQNKTKKKILLVALYKELFVNMMVLTTYLRGEDKLSRDHARLSFRYEAYDYATNEEILMFFQIKEAHTFHIIYSGFKHMLSESNLKKHKAVV